MPLIVRRRKDSGQLEISGTIKPAGQATGIRIRQRPGSDNIDLAREEAVALEAYYLRSHWHGERPADRRFPEAVTSYLKAHQNVGRGTVRLIQRLLKHFGDVALSAIDQEAVDNARDAILKAPSAAGTQRNVIVPLSAILNHASRRGWCSPPRFEHPKQKPVRVRLLLPAQIEAIVQHAAPHIKPLITFLICTGCRVGEAIKIDWSDVDLRGARVILWEGETKSGRRRVVNLPPAAIAALARITGREGRVFKRPIGRSPIATEDYGLSDDGGGQIQGSWGSACRAAGMPGRVVKITRFRPEATPHILRHSWASWHYALHRDLLLLKHEGGWATASQVERYAHILPSGHEDDIRRVWGIGGASVRVVGDS